MAERFTDLYYAAQRAGTTVDEITDLEFAFRKAGLGAGSAASMIKSLGVAMQTDPGKKGILQSIQIQTNDAQEAILEFGEWAKKQKDHGNQAMAVAIGQQLGFGPEQVLALEQNVDSMRANIAKAEAAKKAAGVNDQALAEQSKIFSSALADLGLDFDNIAKRIESTFLPVATVLLKWVDEAALWFTRLDVRTHGLASTIVGIGAAIATGAAALGVLGTVAGVAGVSLEGIGAAAAVLGSILTGPVVAIAAVGAGNLWAVPGLSGLEVRRDQPD